MASLLSLYYYVTVSCLTLPWIAQAQVYLTLKGVAIVNNTVIRIDDIGENDNALLCQTDLTPCCSTPPHRYGEWYYPDGTVVPNFASGQNFYRGRGNDGVVRLNRRNNAQSPSGVYICVVPDRNRRMQRLLVGVASQDAHPVITSHPKDALQVVPGSDVTFSVAARLSTGYVWKFEDTYLEESDKYTGTTSSTLTVYNVQKSDEGEYRCVVGNQLISVISGRARLTLLDPPVILAQPEDKLGVSIGEEVSFVVVTRASKVSYLWEYENGSALPNDLRYDGRNTSILTIFNVNSQDSGIFRCHVSNAAGFLYTETAQLDVGRLYIVESIHVVPDITSAIVTWTPPRDAIQEMFVFQLKYYPVMFPNSEVVLNSTDTEYHAVGLIPLLMYRFEVRLLLPNAPSVWVVANVTLQEHIPAVENLRYEMKDGVFVVEWEPFTPQLLGWNISHYRVSYQVYSVDDDTQATLYNKVELVPGNVFLSNILLDDVPLEPKVEHRIEVSATIDTRLEGIEIIEGERATIVTSLEFEKSLFQVVLGPVEHCITWNIDKASKFQLQIREAIKTAMLDKCKCSFQLDQLDTGVFSCRTNANIVTYRSSISGQNVTELVLHLEDWVKSKTTIVLDWFLVDVYSTCSVYLDSLNEPECNPFKSTPNEPGRFTFSTNSSAVADCVNMCFK